MPTPITVIFDGDSAGVVAASGEAAASFDTLSASAADAMAAIAASMAQVASAVDSLSATIDVLSASIDNMAASSDTAAASVETVGASAGAATADVVTFGDALGAVGATFDALTGQITGMLATFGTLVAVMGAVTVFQDLSNEVQSLISQMFSLDEQTQKTVTSWQYLFGGKQNAQSLAGWAYQESPKLPFTATDLRAGMSALGPVDPNIKQLEHFMPILSDIAATYGATAYGGQGTTLQQAAYAVMMAMSGRTVMLQRDLHVPVEQLVQYGLDATVNSAGAVKIKDMSTMIPAIEAWAQAKGLVGASGNIETNTVWGAYSSFQDYVQNALQTIGGINPATGLDRPGSMFADIQGLLNNVNALLAQGQAGGTKSPVGAATVVGGQIVGGLTTSGGSLLSGLIGGAESSGAGAVVTDIFQKIKDFGEWLTSSSVQKDIKGIGETIGTFLTENLQNAGKALPGLEVAFGKLMTAAKDAWDSLGPQGQKAMQGIPQDILQVVSALLMLAAGALQMAADVENGFHAVVFAAQSIFPNLANQFKTWGRDFISMLIEGMQSMLPNLGAMVNNVAQSIASKLHFSKPEEGPLANADRWMPDMMLMFAGGIQEGLPAVARASQQVAQTIGNPIHGVAPSGGGVSNTYGSTTNYGASSLGLNMYGANEAQMNQLVFAVLQQIDRQQNVALQQAGGYGYRSFGPIG